MEFCRTSAHHPDNGRTTAGHPDGRNTATPSGRDGRTSRGHPDRHTIRNKRDMIRTAINGNGNGRTADFSRFIPSGHPDNGQPSGRTADLPHAQTARTATHITGVFLSPSGRQGQRTRQTAGHPNERTPRRTAGSLNGNPDGRQFTHQRHTHGHRRPHTRHNGDTLPTSTHARHTYARQFTRP